MLKLKSITFLDRFVDSMASMLGFQKDHPQTAIGNLAHMVQRNQVAELEAYVLKLKEQNQNIALMINLQAFALGSGTKDNILELSQTPQMIDRLIELGADLGCVIKDKQPLTEAFESRPDILEHLIDLGIVEIWENRPKYTVSILTKLVLWGIGKPNPYLGAIEALLKRNKDYANKPLPGGQAPLAFCIAMGQPPTVELLLAYGASPYDEEFHSPHKKKKAQHTSVNSPLVAALQLQREAIVDMLLATADTEEKLDKFITEIKASGEEEKSMFPIDYQSKFAARKEMFTLSREIKFPSPEQKNKPVFKM